MKFNINDKVRVRLTEFGKIMHRKHHDEYWESLSITGVNYVAPKEDEHGWSEWQLWVLMEQFGPHLRMGATAPFETEIDIVVAPRNLSEAMQILDVDE